MPIRDTLIKKTKIEIDDVETEDYIYVENYNEIKSLSHEMVKATTGDYAMMIGGINIGEKRNTNYWLLSGDEFVYDRFKDKYEFFRYKDFLYSNKCACPSLQLNLPSEISKYCKFGYVAGFKYQLSDEKCDNGEILHLISFENLRYPQTKVDFKDWQKLENAYKSGKINKTGRIFQGERHVANDGMQDDEIEMNDEYEFEGRTYVRTISKSYRWESFFKDNTNVEPKVYWFEVEPIKWIIRNYDQMPKSINPNGNGKANSIIVRSKDAIIASVPYYKGEICIDSYGDSFHLGMNKATWQNSTLREFLNNNFLNIIYTETAQYVWKDNVKEKDQNNGYIKSQADELFERLAKEYNLEHLI